MAPRSSMETLPENVRREFERRLIENGFGNYTELAEWLNEQGYQISRSAAYRYGSKVERRLASIKKTTEAARLIAEAASDERDSRSEAVMALIQDGILTSLNEIDPETGEAEERLAMYSQVAKNISAFVSASTRLKEYQSKIQAKAQAAADEVAKTVKKGGLSDDTAEQIRKQILGIAT